MGTSTATTTHRSQTTDVYPGIGMEVVAGELSRRGRLTLGLLARLPAGSRERLLFNESAAGAVAQKTLQRVLGGPAPVRIQFTEGLLRGLVFECLTSEKYFVLGQSFEQESQRAVAALVRPGDTVFDVGAHAGFWSFVFAALAAPDGRVFSFEPSPQNFPRLRRNAELNPRVRLTAVNAGASDVEGPARLTIRGSCSQVVRGDAGPAVATAEVRLLTLDDFVFRDGHPLPAFLKIDVEGHAARVLAGARRLLADRRPSLLIELHDPAEVAGVREMLERYGYSLKTVDRRGAFPYNVVADSPLQRR